MEQVRNTRVRAIPIMNSTKLILLLAASGAMALSGAELTGVHTIYVMPMAHGFEQYLANTLTNEHVFVVVTDPKKADAVFTDQIGAGLQDKLDAMLTVAPPPEKTDTAAVDKDDPKGHKSSLVEPENKLQSPAANSTIGHGKGTFFLVETKSRQVVWSTYEVPKDSTSKEADRISSAIVSRLKKDMGLTTKK